jgi:hypothetical protein
VVADFVREPVLHALGEIGFVSVEQELLWIQGEDLGADKSLVGGLPEPKGLWRIAHLAGKWPDSAWLELVESFGATGRSILYRRLGKRWQRMQTIPGEKMFVGIAPWTGDRVLGVVQSQFAFDATFRLVTPLNGVTLLQFSKPKKSASFCVNRLRAEAFGALPSGHVFVGGMVCETLDDDATVIGAAVERWQPGDKRGTIDMLPGMEVGAQHDAISVDSLVARSPTEVYVAAERVRNVEGSPRASQLLRFDGKDWSTVPTSIPGGAARVWLGHGGTLWATDGDGQPWKRTSEGRWARQELRPALPGGRTTSIWQRGEGDVWAVVQTRDRSFVVHSGPVSQLDAR